jgi:hypothetical protein
VAGSCECDNEPSGSIKCAEGLLASQDGLFSMELISYIIKCINLSNINQIKAVLMVGLPILLYCYTL